MSPQPSNDDGCGRACQHRDAPFSGGHTELAGLAAELALDDVGSTRRIRRIACRSECDLRVGGEWIIRFGPDSAPYVERNVFHTVERPHRLAYARPPSGRMDRESLMEISLQWLDRRTLLTLTQRGLPSGDVEREFTERWNEFLDGLVARIQTRPAT